MPPWLKAIGRAIVWVLSKKSRTDRAIEIVADVSELIDDAAKAQPSSSPPRPPTPRPQPDAGYPVRQTEALKPGEVRAVSMLDGRQVVDEMTAELERRHAENKRRDTEPVPERPGLAKAQPRQPPPPPRPAPPAVDRERPTPVPPLRGAPRPNTKK